jgi:diguanylate cyclase (GGDEF)-like protein
MIPIIMYSSVSGIEDFRLDGRDKSSMKRMLMVAVVMLALIPAFLIGYAVNGYIQHTVRVDKLSALDGTVHMMAIHLDQYYKQLISDTESKTETKEVKSLLAAGNSEAMDPESRTEMYKTLEESIGGMVLSGTVIDRNGKTVFSTSSGEEGLTFEKTELFRSIMEGGKSSYIGLVTGKDNSDTFEVAVPIKGRQGENIGIIRQIVKIEFLSTYLGNVSLGKKGEAFLIRNNGYMIDQSGNNELSLYSEYQNNSSLEKLVSDFKQNRLETKKGAIGFYNKGTEYIGSYEKVESIECIAVAATERDFFFGNIVKLWAVYIAIVIFVLLVTALGGYIIESRYFTPLKRMIGTLKKITAGDLGARCDNKGNNEFTELGRNINLLADRYQKNEKELRLSSRIDNLTHLPNQNAINEVLDTLLYKHPNQALVLLDLDGFKDVNDDLGYDVGDRILMEVGDILRGLPQHVCYPSRMGGAEFMVFVTNWTAPKYPEKIAEKIISRIEGIRFIGEIHVNISVNIGIEYTDAERTDKKKLIKYANIAMHKARNIGRNSYFVHYPYMQKE